jgi:hypothetical protein
VGEATDEDGRQVVLTAHLSCLESWRELASDPGWEQINEGFALFLAADASDVPVDVIAAFAEWASEHGMFWFSSWGPDCERVHDVVDEVDVGDGVPEGKPIVMTTWHDDESLDEALFLFWWAFPSEGKRGGPFRVAVTVGEPRWAEAVDRVAQHHLAAMTE